MKVILLQEVKGKGGEGDVVDVARGFANNFLLPRNIAIPATKGNLKQLEQRKHNIDKREETRLAGANQLKEKLEGTVVKVDAKVGEEGQLFGSITSVMVAEAIKDAVSIDIDKRNVELGRPIKTAGEHEVVISLYRGIKTSVKLVVGEPATETPAEETAEAVEVAEEIAEEVVDAVEETEATVEEAPATADEA